VAVAILVRYVAILVKLCSSCLWPNPAGTLTKETWPWDHPGAVPRSWFGCCYPGWMGKGTQAVCSVCGPLASGPANSPVPVANITRAPRKAGLMTVPYQGNLCLRTIYQYLLDKHKICYAPEKRCTRCFSGEVCSAVSRQADS